MHCANPKCSRFDRGVRVRSKLLNIRPSASELTLFRLTPYLDFGPFARISIFPVHEQSVITIESPPVRGARIETVYRWRQGRKAGSPPVRGARIETLSGLRDSRTRMSPPVRGARIETSRRWAQCIPPAGRPPCGGRGLKLIRLPEGGTLGRVAPRAGGAD